ncbi:MAG TPA: nucleotide disphospho-sugar-binding domain-containing protein [Rugosimonospora sp.]|nr:nucleotide disphospho-sugar-binding domain-containing protein [Rugosimonospora sp.]
MRVLFTAGSGGPRLYPMVPLAWACRAAGHEVRLATTPPYPQTMVDDLIGYAARWPADLLVYDAVADAGAVAATVLGIPGVRYLCGVSAFTRIGPLPEYRALFARFGAEPEPPVSYLDSTPPGMRLVELEPRIDLRYVPYHDAGREPAELHALRAPRDRPRACVTWGRDEPCRAAVCRLAESGVDVLMTTTVGQLRALGDLPAGVRGLPGVPLPLLLPYCDVLVQPGGEGATLTGAALGVPQVAVTRTPEHELTAGQLAATGAGVHLRYHELRRDDRGSAICAAVHRVLVDPSYQDSADRLRKEIEAQPSPADVVPGLAALAGARVGG